MRRLALLVMLPGMALAEGLPVVPSPQSCTPLLTVRKTGCSVEHAYRCADGTMLNVEMFIKDGNLVRSTLVSDADFNPILFDDRPNITVSFGPVPADLGNSHLIASGHGAATLAVSVWTEVFADPMVGTMGRQMEVVNRAQVVDGVALVRLRDLIDLELNGGAMQFGGWEDAYVEPTGGVRFRGSSLVTAFGTALGHTIADPVALIYPGEPGFMNDLSVTNCDPASSVAPDVSNPAKEG